MQIDVSAVTFDTLCRRHGVDALDVLHIDTEGYDFELLKNIDFGRFHPRLVIFEHAHLKPEDQPTAIAYMERHGYETLRDGMDTLCLNVRNIRRRERPLLKLWRQLHRDRTAALEFLASKNRHIVQDENCSQRTW